MSRGSAGTSAGSTITRRRSSADVEARARPGFQIKEDTARDVGRVIWELLSEGKGDTTADDLIRHAKSSRSPAHRHFPWDDAKAAHEHRLDLARKYLRGIYFVRVQITRNQRKEGKPIRVLAVTQDSDTIDKRKAYVTEEKLAKDKTLAKYAIVDAIRQLDAWRKRFNWLREYAKLTGVFESIDSIVRELGLDNPDE